MRFEKVILNDVAIVYDSLHKSPKYTENGIPMVRVRDLDYGFLKLEDTVFVDIDTYEEFSKKHKPTKGDIIFSRVGSYGITSYVDSNEVFCLGQNTVSIVSKEIDSKFLYYTLLSPMVRQQIEMVVTGSTQKTISLKNIRNLTLFIPKREEQQKISSFLYSLDKRIDNNEQLISNSEELAQTLFKHWFVDFEFPNEEGKPYKSSGGKMVESELGMIPEGWEVKSIAELGEITIGGDWGKEEKSDELTPVYCFRGVDIQHLNEFGYAEKAPIRWVKKSSVKKRSITDRDVLLGGSGAGPVGRSIHFNENINQLYSFPIIYSNFCKRISCLNEYTAYYISRIFNYMYNSGQMHDYVNGTSVPNLDIKSLIKKKVILPNSNLLEYFYRTYIMLLYKKKFNGENLYLEELRNTLLPKLLSGEIELPDDMEVTDDVPIS